MNVGKNTIVYLLSPRQLVFELTDMTVRGALGPKASTVQINNLKRGELPSCYDVLVVDLYSKQYAKKYSNYVSHYLPELSLLKVPVLFLTPKPEFKDVLDEIGLTNFESANISNYLESLETMLNKHKVSTDAVYKVDRRMGPAFEIQS